MDQELERERAAEDGILPGTIVGARRAPAAPEGCRRVDPRLHRLARGEDQRLGVGGRHREQRAPALHDLEPSADRRVGEVDGPRVPGADGDGVGAAGGDGHRPSALDPRGARAVREARLDAPPQPHPPGETLDPSRQLTQRVQPVIRQRHGVGDADHAARRREGRLEDVGVGEVAAGDLVGIFGAQHEATTSLVVEHGREDARRIEVGKTEPVDRAVPADESRRPAVPDRRVVPDRQIPPHYDSEYMGGPDMAPQSPQFASRSS